MSTKVAISRSKRSAISVMSSELDRLLAQGIQEGVFPGAAYAVGNTKEVYIGVAGRHTYSTDSPPIVADSLFDLASLTKVIATTTSAMLLWQDCALHLDQPVQELVPEFVGEGKSAVTIRQLLIHESGLPAHRDFWKLHPEERWPAILAEPLESSPGAETRYSCVGFLVLQQVLQRLTGERYEEAWAWPFFRVVDQLGLDVCFSPTADQTELCVPTEGSLQGVVHDENSRSLGGMAANSGLFGTIEAVAAFAQWIMATRNPMWTTRQGLGSRALGWDTNFSHQASAGAHFSENSFGHTGFTGTSLWIDPDRELIAILLTNRVHPIRDNDRIRDFRLRFHEHVFASYVS